MSIGALTISEDAIAGQGASASSSTTKKPPKNRDWSTSMPAAAKLNIS